ncbi:MAG: metalloregulator ArsR/SmtB family transcription factor [Hyphomicrobiales bacterium]
METNIALDKLHALGHETRLEVFQRLMRSHADGISAGSLADAMDILPNTLSTHLGQLKRAGLISVTRQGRSLYYRANNTGIRDLLLFLMKDCCGGKPDLCAPIFDQLNAAQQPHKQRQTHEL